MIKAVNLFTWQSTKLTIELCCPRHWMHHFILWANCIEIWILPSGLPLLVCRWVYCISDKANSHWTWCECNIMHAFHLLLATSYWIYIEFTGVLCYLLRSVLNRAILYCVPKTRKWILMIFWLNICSPHTKNTVVCLDVKLHTHNFRRLRSSRDNTCFASSFSNNYCFIYWNKTLNLSGNYNFIMMNGE